MNKIKQKIKFTKKEKKKKIKKEQVFPFIKMH